MQTLSGTVSLYSNNPSGVKVLIVDSDDNYIGSTTTDSNGNWSYTVPNGMTAHVVFQYDDGSTKYNAACQAFIEILGNGSDSFENDTVSNSPSNWDSQNAAVVDSTASHKSQSVRNYYHPTSNGYIMRRTGLSDSPDKVSFAYRETSSSAGICYKLLNSTGDEILAVGSANPQVSMASGDGEEILINNPSPNYGQWRKFIIDFNWSNTEFDVTWKDLTGNTSDITRTSRSFLSGSNSISQAFIGHREIAGNHCGPNGNEWVDEVWGAV